MPPPSTSVSRSSALSLACLAASGLTTAGVVGSLELAALAAAGAVVAGAHALRMRRVLRSHGTVLAFLGDGGAVRSRLGWCSPDGSRRVRRGTDGRLVFEELLPDGTARAYRARAPESGRLGGSAGHRISVLRAGYTLRGVYTLHGRAVRPACFSGLPATLGGTPEHVPAAFVRLERGADVVRLVRVDRRGHDAGETVHFTEAEAERQLRVEFGAHLGPLREGDPPMRKTPRKTPQGWEGDAASGVGL